MRSARAGYALLAAGLFALYLPTLARGVTASDGPEILTAVTTLGVVHPTGYPVFTVVAHLFSRLCPASLAPCIRVEILDALAGSGAAVFAALATRSLAEGRLGARARDAHLGALFAGAVLGTCPLLWDQVRIPEVYAFHLLLVAWATWALARFEETGEDRWVVHAALPMGIGLAHHVTMIYLVAAALLYLAVRKPAVFYRRALPLALVVGALPLGAYGYLIWATDHTSGVAWGAPGDWDTLYRHVTAVQYRHYVGGAGLAEQRERLGALPSLLLAQLLPAGSALALGGVVALGRRAWRPLLLLVAFMVLNLGHGVFYAVRDHETYDLPAVLPAAVLAGLGLAEALRLARGRAAIAVAAFVAELPLALYARSLELGQGDVVTEGYGAEVARQIPPGAVYLTRGDGFVFTMWYENHVLDRGRDFVTLDAGNLRTWWYQGYLARHYPEACDPLAPAFRDDPGAYGARCGTYAARLAVGGPGPWASLGLDPPAPGTLLELGPPSSFRVVRGGDARCEDTRFRSEHVVDACRCWGYADRKGRLAEDCIYSVDEGGIVPRQPGEVLVQRVIEDAIDERPVFERNVLTHWSDRPGESARGWEGPTFQRVSGDYALLNRGPVNRILHAADVLFDPCATAALRRVAPRPLDAPRPRPHPPDRRRVYQPNEAPTLLSATWLAPRVGAPEAEGTLDFAAGDAVFLHPAWFERFHYDTAAADHRGAPIRHGVRVCVFDPAGRRVALRTARSGQTSAVLLLGTTPASPRGVYTVEACSMGEIGDGPAAPDRACERAILEVELTVR